MPRRKLLESSMRGSWRQTLPVTTALAVVISCVLPQARAFTSPCTYLRAARSSAVAPSRPAITTLATAPSASVYRRGWCVMASGRGLGGEEYDKKQPGDVSWDNPWEPAMGDDHWYMNTARIQYLREMERLGEEQHELTAGTGTPLGGLHMTRPGGALGESANKQVFDELASLEHIRALETQVAEKCLQNWREEPVFSKPVGYVPGGRKVQAVKLSNKRVMYGSDSGFVGLANTVNGNIIFGHQAHSALVTAVDYDASFGWMISAADDGVVTVYRETDEHVTIKHKLRNHSNRVVAAEILDNMLAMTASLDGKIVVFELEHGTPVMELWSSDMLLAASVCKGYIFVGLMSGVCEAFSIRNGGRSAFRYIAQRCPIRSLKAIPTANNIKIVVGGQDGLIRQFHVRPVMTTDVWKMPSDRSFDDRLVLMCNTHVEAENGAVDQGFVMRGHRAPVVTVTCDEDKIVSASEDGSLMVWDAVKGTSSYRIRQHVDGDLVSAVDFNERYLVADGTSGSVYVWDYAVAPPPRRAEKPRGGGGGGRGRHAPPLPPPPTNMPFIGGWNLGGGPTEMGDIGGVMGLQGGLASGQASEGGEGGEEGGSGAAAPEEGNGGGGGDNGGGKGRRGGWGTSGRGGWGRH